MEQQHGTPPPGRGSESGLRFYIPVSSSLPERRPRTLKHGDSFGLFDHNGDIVGGEGSPEGLYHEDTRYVSVLRLTINGQRPLLLGSAVKDDNSLLTADLTNPDLFLEGELDQRRNTIHLARARFLWDRASYERVSAHNFDDRARGVSIAFEFACDFADIFEVRGARRPRRGAVSARVEPGRAVTYTYEGLDGRVRRAIIRFDPAPALLDANHARFDLTLQPGERAFLVLAIQVEPCPDTTPPRHAFIPRLREARRALRRSTARAASVETSNAVFNEVLCRSMSDLYMLITDTDYGPYPYAGLPWFSTVFGRDGLLTAMQTLWIDPDIARGVLGFLAATQAREADPETEAEPGKILHETRKGEMAQLGEVPFRHYYGSVDSTPLFVMLAGLHFERTGDLEAVRALWPNIEAALDWIDTCGDRDGDGFIEYDGASGSGLVNQGWKDSLDSVFHADGRLAGGAIALCEVQGYVWAARTLAAAMARALGLAPRAEALEKQAEGLRRNFENVFWCEEISSYAIALDGDKAPCRVRASNAGHLLFTGIAAPERAARIADQLLDPDFFSGWGVRTLAATEARYSPMSYHNGSIWPHDNALIAAGLKRYGHTGHVQRLFAGLFEAAAYMDLRRLPELYCGFRRMPGKGPTFYPVTCSPQAWASVAPFTFLQACLGIEFDPAGEAVWFRRPCLPEFLDEVVLRNLALPGGRLDVILHRYGDEVSVNVLRREGGGTVSVSV